LSIFVENFFSQFCDPKDRKNENTFAAINAQKFRHRTGASEGGPQKIFSPDQGWPAEVEIVDFCRKTAVARML